MFHLNKKFCEIYGQYFGQKIDSPEQLESCKMTGVGLKNFCEFYLKQFRTSDEIKYSQDDRKVSRVLWFTLGFIIAILFSLATIQYDLIKY
jgi:hypothetical protein